MRYIEDLVRRIPEPIRNYAIVAINTIRVERPTRTIALRWITLFITDYCNARCDHCFFASSRESAVTKLRTSLKRT
jgi:2-iminoacetate synthase ThiH